MTQVLMLCAHCGDRLGWPKDFPLRIYAECARCIEKRSRPRPGLWGRLKSWVRAPRA
jgi:hypothetical protein